MTGCHRRLKLLIGDTETSAKSRRACSSSWSQDVFTSLSERLMSTSPAAQFQFLKSSKSPLGGANHGRCCKPVAAGIFCVDGVVFWALLGVKIEKLSRDAAETIPALAAIRGRPDRPAFLAKAPREKAGRDMQIIGSSDSSTECFF